MSILSPEFPPEFPPEFRALREIGLPEGEVPAALLSLNLGGEAGQLLVIAAVLALRRAVQRLRPQSEPRAGRLAACAIGITGSYRPFARIIAQFAPADAHFGNLSFTPVRLH